ncbi:MAG: hypothetical protein QM771_17660, partial [Nitrospira sp.]
MGHLILVATALRLSENGIGLFVVSNSFFWSARSVKHHFKDLGLGIEAALALPAGAFAPYMNIQTTLVVVGRRSFDRMFVAQLSNEPRTNAEIVANFKAQRDTGGIDLGRLVEPRGAVRILSCFPINL